MHPIRCFNCGKVFGNKFEEFNKLKETKNKDWIFKHLKLDRICCRMNLMTSIETSSIFLQSNYTLPPNLKRIPSIKNRNFIAR